MMNKMVDTAGRIMKDADAGGGEVMVMMVVTGSCET
jgi:hypothetical protein